MDQVLTQEKAIFGPSFDATNIYIYIYIYIYITYVVKVLTAPSLAILMVINWSK